MASSTPKTIILSLNACEDGKRPYDSAIVKAASPVTPGQLITWDSGEVKPNATAADADAQSMVAVENPYLDPRTNTSPAIDTAYAAAATCYFIYPVSGDKLYMWLEAAANVAKGAALESNGAGYLQAYTSGRILFFADEAKDNSGGGSAVRIKVRAA